jgi:DNA-binding transcriptional MerR regulator
MPTRPLRTSDVARAVGVHPNTVRLYEEWGFIPPVPRSAHGYRLYSRRHVDLMRLARTILHYPYPGGKDPTLDMVRRAVAGDLAGALAAGRAYVAQIQAERAQAEAAVAALEHWAQGQADEPLPAPLRITPAARLVGLTVDILHSWERDGLLRVPRDPANGYRLYGAAEIARLRVIRILRRSGYSTMAILRTLQQFEDGRTEELGQVLDTPRPDEEVLSAADRWLSTLAAQERRACDAIEQLQAMLAVEAHRDGPKPS